MKHKIVSVRYSCGLIIFYRDYTDEIPDAICHKHYRPGFRSRQRLSRYFELVGLSPTYYFLGNESCVIEWQFED